MFSWDVTRDIEGLGIGLRKPSTYMVPEFLKVQCNRQHSRYMSEIFYIQRLE